MGLIIDSFAGAGGASTGIEAAGRPVDIAINHWGEALAIHAQNHPGARHLAEDVRKVRPLQITGGRPVDLLWASPDCTHFSSAKGGAPVRLGKGKDIRGLAWQVVRWAQDAHPRVIVVENVKEFQGWGPLKAALDAAGRPLLADDGEPMMIPDKTRRGLTFRRWAGRLRGLGYAVEWRTLVAADYGAPTTRERLFVIARRDGEPISWPEPTHRDPAAGEDMFGGAGLQPWRTAAECIDRSIPCPSIFERKRPLKDKTLARVAKGVERFVFGCAEPFIIGIDHQSSRPSSMVWGLGAPVTTVTGENRHALVTAFLNKYRGGSAGSAIDAPVPTITSGQGAARLAGAPHALGLTAIFISKFYGGVVGHGLDRPIGTVTGVDHHGLVSAHLLKMYGTSVGADLRQPMPVVTGSGNHLFEVRAFLVKYFGTSTAQALNAPLGTLTSRDRYALGVVLIGGEPWQIVDIGLRMLQPHELAAAQGFPAGYILPANKSRAVKMIGNSVCPPVAEAIVRANLGDGAMEAVALGRRVIGIELSREYFEVAVRRIEGALRQPTFF